AEEPPVLRAVGPAIIGRDMIVQGNFGAEGQVSVEGVLTSDGPSDFQGGIEITQDLRTGNLATSSYEGSGDAQIGGRLTLGDADAPALLSRPSNENDAPAADGHSTAIRGQN